jgi:HAD superfamily hydrolase (TIGR01459 family)
MVSRMQALSSIFDITDQFDAFLCDLWGVIHDGEYLYPNVLETLEALNAAGKQIMFLSNAPRSADSVIQKMKQMGVKREWYLGALTSGEAARRYLMDIPKYAVEGNQFLKGNYYYQGFESDIAILEGLPQQRVATIKDADFMICSNFDHFFQPYGEISSKLEMAAKRDLPMLCINPDIEVVKIDGRRVLCSGWLAARYEELGGKVGYIGKPHSLVYEMAMQDLAGIAKDRIAMIGDNLLTDIKGGKAAGIATILVTQGVMQNESAQEACKKVGFAPDYVLSAL